MRSFAYERPTDLGEAIGLLEGAGPDGLLLAGGTDLVVGLRGGSLTPRVVIDLKRIQTFAGPAIRVDDDRLRFSALAVMGTIESDPVVLERLPALAEAARVVGSVQIRNRATLAGNVCNGSPAADTTPALLVYEAVVEIAGPDGSRRLPIDDFVVGPGTTALAPGELVTAIEVPLPAAGTGAAYNRLVRRRGTDLASVTMCASLDAADRVRLAYGSVGPRAFLVTDDSGLLVDDAAAPGERAERLDELLAQASPSPTSIRAGPDYRRAMLPVLAGRALAVARSRRMMDGSDA